ncbi:MAG: shikimate kinase [Pseudomonadota bacterium]
MSSSQPAAAAETEPTWRLRRSVALIGLMGCGKTTVGARLAALIGAEFRDADAEIVAAAGMSIPEIFENLGEGAFRDGERKVIARLMGERPMVLATGGGAFMAAETRDAIRAAGVSIWLSADLETLVERTSRRKSRPLLNKGDPRRILGDLIDQRYPVYAEADLVVESTATGAADNVARAALDALIARDAGLPPEDRVLEAV